jgi:multidrug resistance efflux pump
MLVAAGAAAWSLAARPVPKPDAAGRGQVTVRRGSVPRTLLVSGELVAVQATRIAVPRFRERGAVPIQAMASEGSQVSAGDVLLQLDNANLTTRLSADLLALDKAENDLVRKSAEEESRAKDLELQQATLRLDMEKAKLRAELPADVLSLRDWQDHQHGYRLAQLNYERSVQATAVARAAGREDLARLRIARDQLRARIDLARRDLEALRVTATTAGTVVYEYAPLTWNSGEQPRKFQPGDQVSAGTIVMTVADLSDLQARIQVSEVDGGLVEAGMRARVTPESGGRVAVPGKLVSIREVAERQRRLSNVRVFVGTVALDRTDRTAMKPGMSVRVELVLGEQEGLIVPRSAVGTDDGATFVRDPAGARRPISVIARNPLDCLIEGLSEGDKIARVVTP